MTDYSRNPVAAIQVARTFLVMTNITTFPEPHRERLLALATERVNFIFLTRMPEALLALLLDPDADLGPEAVLGATEALRATAQACAGSDFSGKLNRWLELEGWAASSQTGNPAEDPAISPDLLPVVDETPVDPA